MRIHLLGGFGEKGRTSLAIESKGYRLMLDAGINTSVPMDHADYYPRVSPAALAATNALIITHAHEDHVTALGWALAHGFAGRILMGAETARDADVAWAAYAAPDDRARAKAAAVEPLPARGTVTLGPFTVTTGRSGHIVGGSWCVIDDGERRFAYCGDVVPDSPVFMMDPLPPCDAIAIDASYGDDDVPARERARQVAAFVAEHPEGCVLPTPLAGRSLELLAILPEPIALAPGMRASLEAQLAADEWLRPGVSGSLAARLAAARDWREGEPLPQAALLCHDGMGMSGPAATILPLAEQRGHPVLFTGHLPKDSPGDRMVRAGRAAWNRLPTHPTLGENRAIVSASGARVVLGHSCDPATLRALAAHIPLLRADLSTGASLDI